MRLSGHLITDALIPSIILVEPDYPTEISFTFFNFQNEGNIVFRHFLFLNSGSVSEDGPSVIFIESNFLTNKEKFSIKSFLVNANVEFTNCYFEGNNNFFLVEGRQINLKMTNILHNFDRSLENFLEINEENNYFLKTTSSSVLLENFNLQEKNIQEQLKINTDGNFFVFEMLNDVKIQNRFVSNLRAKSVKNKKNINKIII